MGVLMEPANVNLGCPGASSFRVKTTEAKSVTMAVPASVPYYTFTVSTRETEFGKIIEPIPICTINPGMYNSYSNIFNGYVELPQRNGFSTPVKVPVGAQESPVKESANVPSSVAGISSDVQKTARPPPKKKWIRDYLEEEPRSPMAVTVVTAVPPRTNGMVLPQSIPSVIPRELPTPSIPIPTVAIPAVSSQDFLLEHSRPRTNGPQIPSPPIAPAASMSPASMAAAAAGQPRAGTREVHNKLEKNRRAHLKECFELLKRQLPSSQDDKKTSNLSILGSAIRYIQVLRRKERECEHEMERLAREKIAAQQRLAALKRDLTSRPLPRTATELDERERDNRLNGQVLGIPISITSNGSVVRTDSSPPRSLNLSTKLRTLPIQIAPSSSQMVRTSYGSRHNTLTLTTLAPAPSENVPTAQNGQPVENGLSPALGTALVHPAHLHLPLSQVVRSGSLVVGGALQLLSAPGALRVLTAPHNGVTLPRENGTISPRTEPEAVSNASVVVSGLAPLVVSQPAAHLLQTHTLTHKMVETQVVKGSVAPLTVSAQYLSATTIVKPMVVVSAAPTPTTST